MPAKFSKFIYGFAVTIFLFVSVFGGIVTPRVARAQVGDGPIAATNLPLINEAVQALRAKFIAKEVEMKWYEVMLLAAYMGITQAIQSFITRLAYDSAVFLAAGGKGETPFSHFSSFGDYMADVANDAGGWFLQGLGDMLGVDLCSPGTLALDLALRLGLKGKYFPEKPKCTFTAFLHNWKQVGTSRYWKNMAQNFNFAIKPADSDLGIYLDSSVRVDDQIKQKTYGAEKQRNEGQGAIGMTDIIAGNIKTPAQVMQKEFQNQSASEKSKTNTQVINSSMASGMKDILYYTPAVFFNTFFSQVLSNFFTKGMLFGYCVSDACKKTSFDWPSAPDLNLDEINGGGGDDWTEKGGGDKDNPANNPEDTVVSGRQVAEAMFLDFLRAPVNSIDEYNLINLFSACPANPSPDNCVVDFAFASALNEPVSTGGRYLTIKQAMDRDLLHKSFKLLPPSNVEDQTANCYQRYYCYSNIRKLRQARVLPLGFEIAAKNSNPDTPWSLEQVVNGYYDCAYDNNGNVVYDVKHPFCHLINPNWVLKMSPHRCNAMVYGSAIEVPGSGLRAQECADLQGCVGYSIDGKSCQSYGYCLKEKNIWKFNADNCEEQYASCIAVKSGNKQTGYLYRTLDTGFCNAENSGCAVYSVARDDSGGWKLPEAPSSTNNYTNTAIHFNSKVTTDCSAKSSGCSAYTAKVDEATIYLRRAPDYLGCYDRDPATAIVDWPDSISDINGISTNLSSWKKAECAKYSAPCIAAEENCNMYTAAVSGEPIPGKYQPARIAGGVVESWGDQCDAKCDGYAAYREMPSAYSNGANLAYVIPKSGNRCTAAEEGCAAFTNMSTLQGQMEKVEYYSYLRSCIRPGQAASGKYFTYESTQTEGVQLKVYILQTDTTTPSVSDPTGIAGGPAYVYRTPADLIKFKKVCNAEVYAKGSKVVPSATAEWDDALSPDCRQFTDDKGHTYYRILSATVPVSQTCTPYRLNNSELDAETGKCFNNGEIKDGFCYYYGLPAGENNTAGVSRVCSAATETCRAYKGNAGNNVRNIFYDKFEEDGAVALTDWSAGSGSLSVATESTKAGEHSLTYYNGAPGNFVKSTTLTPGKSYDLSFWAKGAGDMRVNIYLENGSNTTLGSINLSDSWRYYHLGPVELAGTATSTRLTVALSTGGRVYVDNIKLMEVEQYLYLVKKTLSVDPVCDSNTIDNLPGEALGCTRYNTPSNQTYYLTNFSFLCREEAIGCTAVYDTYNTIGDAGENYYNVWLPDPSLTPGKLSITLNSKEYSCQNERGKSGCYTNVAHESYASITGAAVNRAGTGAINQTAQITSSTVHVPADTASSTPIYLVANQAATCSASDVGCTDAGLMQGTPMGQRFTAVRIKNLPSAYFGASGSAGTLCTGEAVGCNTFSSVKGDLYFKDPKVIGNKICAWQTRVDRPGYGQTFGWFWKGVGRCSASSANSPDYCVADGDCTSAGDKCIDKDQQPCYPDYLVDYQKYDLWSYGTNSNYNGFVGECPLAQSGCTEYTDHNDCRDGKCQSYYLLYNDKFTPSLGACNGQASLAQGCVLLDQTDIVNKYWNTTSTYRVSNAQNGEKVAPLTANPDANVIAQALPDRACSEWAYCRLANYRFNPNTNKTEQECYMLGVCDKFLPGSGDQKCAHDVTVTRADKDKVITDRDLPGLSAGYVNYLTRDITWGGPDYTGFSMFTYKSSEPHLAPSDYVVGNYTSADNLSPRSPANIQTSTFECRGYPEADSPFPLTVLTNGRTATSGYKQGFERVKFCESDNNGNPQNCDCNYVKLDYNLDSPAGALSSMVAAKSIYWPADKLDDAPKGFWSQTGEEFDCVKNVMDENKNKNYYRFETYDFKNHTRGSKYLFFPRKLYKGSLNGGLEEFETPPDCIITQRDDSGKALYLDCSGNSQALNSFDNYFVHHALDDTNFRVAMEDAFNEENLDVVFFAPSQAGQCLPLQNTKQTVGWKGYCMEYDLRRPLNGTANSTSPQYGCLSWLPVNNPRGVNNASQGNPKGAWNNGDNYHNDFDKDRSMCVDTYTNHILIGDDWRNVKKSCCDANSLTSNFTTNPAGTITPIAPSIEDRNLPLNGWLNVFPNDYQSFANSLEMAYTDLSGLSHGVIFGDSATVILPTRESMDVNKYYLLAGGSTAAGYINNNFHLAIFQNGVSLVTVGNSYEYAPGGVLDIKKEDIDKIIIALYPLSDDYRSASVKADIKYSLLPSLVIFDSKTFEDQDNSTYPTFNYGVSIPGTGMTKFVDIDSSGRYIGNVGHIGDRYFKVRSQFYYSRNERMLSNDDGRLKFDSWGWLGVMTTNTSPMENSAGISSVIGTDLNTDYYFQRQFQPYSQSITPSPYDFDYDNHLQFNCQNRLGNCVVPSQSLLNEFPYQSGEKYVKIKILWDKFNNNQGDLLNTILLFNNTSHDCFDGASPSTENERLCAAKAHIGYNVFIKFKNPDKVPDSTDYKMCYSIAKVSKSGGNSNPYNFLPVTWRYRSVDAGVGFGNFSNSSFQIFDRLINDALGPFSLLDKNSYGLNGENVNFRQVEKPPLLWCNSGNENACGKNELVHTFNNSLPFIDKECRSFSDSGLPITDRNNAYCALVNRLFRRIYGIFEANKRPNDVNIDDVQGIGNLEYDVRGGASSYFDAASPAATNFTRYPPIIAAPDLNRDTYVVAQEENIYETCKKSGIDCKIAALDALSVNGQIRGDVVVKAGDEVKVRYYAWAHPNQMALESMITDFADTRRSPGESAIMSGTVGGSLANRKPHCEMDPNTSQNVKSCEKFPEIACTNDTDCRIGDVDGGPCSDAIKDMTDQAAKEKHFYGFGSSVETGCEAGFVQAGYIYECPMPTTTFDRLPTDQKFPLGPYAKMMVGARSGHPEEIEISETHTGFFLKNGDIVCAYRPRVQVVDHWGWCNGGCHASTQDSPVRGIARGCYNYPDNPNTATNESTNNQECDKFQNDLVNGLNFPKAGDYAYTPYNGHVIVIPSEKL